MQRAVKINQLKQHFLAKLNVYILYMVNSLSSCGS